MNNKATILITGPLPAPAGGISIHILRLYHLLEGEYNIDFIDESPVRKHIYFNIRSLNVFTYFKKIASADLLFIHSGNRLFKKIHIITGKLFAKKIIITLHGYGSKRKQPFRAFDNFVFNLADKIILVNPSIAHRLSLNPAKCIVKHAFLPPIMEQEPALPLAVQEWINHAKMQSQVIVCANASRLDLHKNEDLYGLDMCIAVADRLVSKGLPVSFIFTVSSIDGCMEMYEKNQAMIRSLQLDKHFLLVHGALSFVKLAEQADVVLRPTNTDGDALTIREALFLGKRTLVSDVTERPVGSILFKTRDVDDMQLKLEAIINPAGKTISSIEKIKELNNDFKRFYIGLIDGVLKICPAGNPAVTNKKNEGVLI